MTQAAADLRVLHGDAPFVLLGGSELAGRGPGESVPLTEDADHHLRRVLRRDDGSPLVVSDGQGRVVTAELSPTGARLVASPEVRRPPRPRLQVLQGLPKGRKIEGVVRTLTELGVARITPVESERAVRTLEGDRRERRHHRWQAVARAACEQARRAHRPVVDPSLSLEEALELVDGPLIVADVAAPRRLRPVLRELRDPDSVGVAIGPEGGWSDRERDRLEALVGRRARLGDTVLRTEHAAAVVTGAVACELGWFG